MAVRQTDLGYIEKIARNILRLAAGMHHGKTFPMAFAHPVLDQAAAARHEEARFASGIDHEAAAMERAGRAVALGIEQSLGERFGSVADGMPVLLIVGKGHNGGDVALAAMHLARRYPTLRFFAILLREVQKMRPLTRAAWQRFCQSATELTLVPADTLHLRRLREALPEFDGIVIDGGFGFNFRPPLREPEGHLFSWLSRAGAAGIRFAVDLPSGLGDPNAFRADVTIATGIVKAEVLRPEASPWRGRLRYADIGFFEESQPLPHNGVLAPEVLDPLRHLRPADTDKRTFGRIWIDAGSDRMPGALQIAVRAALNAGGGLVTGHSTPIALAAAAAAAPAAMWSVRGTDPIPPQLDAALIGPGMNTDPGSIAQTVRNLETSLVLDADALHPVVAETVSQRPGDHPVVFTPHPGEISRLLGLDRAPFDEEILRFCRDHRAIVVAKDSLTRIFHPAGILHSPYGGPILARGGSGDGLAGILVALLPRFQDPLAAVAAGVAWQGRAADYRAAILGAEGGNTLDWIEVMAPALRQPPLAIRPTLPRVPL